MVEKWDNFAIATVKYHLLDFSRLIFQKKRCRGKKRKNWKINYKKMKIKTKKMVQISQV
jgi:hypothetical protein